MARRRDDPFYDDEVGDSFTSGSRTVGGGAGDNQDADGTGGGGEGDQSGGTAGTGDTGTGDTGTGDTGDTRVDKAPAPTDPRGGTGGGVNINYKVPEAGEGPGAIESSGTGPDDATPWEVTEEQTVAGQMDKNYDRDNPFMQKAAAKAERGWQAQGGQNSLMAQKAGQSAAMDVAFKMSFEDAKTYARSAEFNAAMKNQFGLAEQRFIQNSLLSEQNYGQAIELQTQMIAGQLEGIAAQYQGKSQLMDKEFAQFFDKETFKAEIREYGEQTGYQRAVSLQGIISRGQFLSNGFDSVMQYANNPNFTPEQSAAAIRSGMQWLRDTSDVHDAFWNSVGSSESGQPDYSQVGTYPDWWSYNETPPPGG